MRVELTVISLDLNGLGEPIVEVYSQSEITLGRSPYNDFVFESEAVSDWHAKLRIDEDADRSEPQLYVTDLGSTNGTQIDDALLLPQIETRLAKNQRIILGDHMVRVRLLDEERSSADVDGAAQDIQPHAAQPFLESVSVTAENIESTVEIHFTAVELFSIRGVVRYHDEPLEGVAVTCEGIGAVETGEDGSYEFSNVADGTQYVVTADKEGYAFTESSHSGEVSQDTYLEFECRKLTSIRGRVMRGEEPLAKVQIDAGELGEYTTGFDGRFVIHHVLEATPYELRASKRGYSIDCEGESSGVAGVVPLAVDFSARKLVDIRGRITRKDQPLAGVAVAAGELGATVTETDGTFLIADVPEGSDYHLQAEKEGFSFDCSGSVEGTLKDRNLQLHFCASRLINIRGRVHHHDQPLAGVLIDGGELGTRTTDEKGWYEFAEVPEGGTYSFKAIKDGFQIGCTTSVLEYSAQEADELLEESKDWQLLAGGKNSGVIQLH